MKSAHDPLPTRRDAVDYDRYHARGVTSTFGDVFERVRLKTVTDVLMRTVPIRPGGVVLDLGSGEGRYLPVFRRLFPVARLVALEYSEVASRRSAARHEFAQHLVASAEAIPLERESVDAIISIEVLEHVPDAQRMLTECARVLRPGAWALLTTPCGNVGSVEWLVNFVSRSITAGVGDGILFGKTEDPTHLRRYRSAELKRRCASVGLRLVQLLYNGHAFLTLAGRLEMLTNAHINIRRRSPRAAEAFARAVDAIALLDWRIARRVPWASSMMLLLEKQRV
jgi:SAM-dependent methyltransferase